MGIRKAIETASLSALSYSILRTLPFSKQSSEVAARGMCKRGQEGKVQTQSDQGTANGDGGISDASGLKPFTRTFVSRTAGRCLVRVGTVLPLVTCSRNIRPPSDQKIKISRCVFVPNRFILKEAKLFLHLLDTPVPSFRSLPSDSSPRLMPQAILPYLCPNVHCASCRVFL